MSTLLEAYACGPCDDWYSNLVPVVVIVYVLESLAETFNILVCNPSLGLVEARLQLVWRPSQPYFEGRLTLQERRT
jgi:hypothetical protein